MRIEHGYKVTRDQGYGRVYCRHYNTHKEAEAAMKLWQREGIEKSHPSIINGGEWSIKSAKYEVRENGAKIETY